MSEVSPSDIFAEIISTKGILIDIRDSLKKNDRLWTVNDLAEYLGFHPNYVYQIKERPGFPRPVNAGKQPRWIPDDIREWAKANR